MTSAIPGALLPPLIFAILLSSNYSLSAALVSASMALFGLIFVHFYLLIFLNHFSKNKIMV